MISDAQKAANAAGAIATGLLSLIIPVPLTTVQWANKHYYLPKESSYTPGRWETLPFQVGIMNCMGNDLIRTVNLIKSARVGYTKMLLGVEAYFIEHKSRNSLLFQPTDSAAEDFMKSHVEPTIREVPALLELAPWFGRKHRDNTLTLKRFPPVWVSGVWGERQQKTTVKNPWMWSVMTSFPRSNRMLKKRVRQPCWGINVLRALYGPNPFAARRLNQRLLPDRKSR